MKPSLGATRVVSGDAELTGAEMTSAVPADEGRAPAVGTVAPVTGTDAVTDRVTAAMRAADAADNRSRMSPRFRFGPLGDSRRGSPVDNGEFRSTPVDGVAQSARRRNHSRPGSRLLPDKTCHLESAPIGEP